MKITFVCPYFSVNGGHRVVATYAAELQSRGHDVTIVSKGPRALTWREKVKHITGWKRRIPGQTMPLAPELAGHHIQVIAPDAPPATAIPDADIVIATFWITAQWVADLPPEKGRKFYLIQDYEMFGYLPVAKIAASYDLPLKKIAVSCFIRDQIIDNHGFTDVAIIHNSVDTTQFSMPARAKPGTPTIGFLYTTSERKNVQLAIAAAERAKSLLPNLRVIAFGSKPPKEKLPLPDWVEFQLAPSQAAIPDIYGACDAWLFTSESEGFGLPILEAMACRTPVLATAAGAAPQLIDGTNGKILAPTVDAFAAEIVAFAQMSDETWQGFSRSAHDTATSHTWQDATDQLLQAFGDNAVAR